MELSARRKYIFDRRKYIFCRIFWPRESIFNRNILQKYRADQFQNIPRRFNSCHNARNTRISYHLWGIATSGVPMKNLSETDRRHLKGVAIWMELCNAHDATEGLEKIDPKLLDHPDVLEIRWRIYAAAERQRCQPLINSNQGESR